MPNSKSSSILFFALLCAGVGRLSGRQLLEQKYLEPGYWLSYDRDNTAQRYSPLSEINTSNVGKLAVQWTFQFPKMPPRPEATPLVRDGIMYFTVSGDEAFALDARTGRTLWRFLYVTKSPGRLVNRNRGFAISGHRLFMGTLDGHLLALDARNGSLLWKVKIADPEQNYYTAGAPLIVKDLVIMGQGGGDDGTRGFLDAYRSETGERVWRFYTIPAPGEPGSETWPLTDIWKRGGAATWVTGSYDPNLNLIYWPTGNPGPNDYDGVPVQREMESERSPYV